MSYTLFNSDGPVQALASIGGMSALLDFVTKTVPHGALLEFIKSGETDDAASVIKDIDVYMPSASSIALKATMLNLKKGLSQCKGFAGISE